MPAEAELLAAALTRINSTWSSVPVNGGWLLITTSHQYSDGDNVEVLVRQTGRTVEVTDGGEALARLDLAGVSVDRGRAREIWRRLLRAHELELDDGRLALQGSLDNAGELIDNMASAVENIDGIRLLAPPAHVPPFAERLVVFFQSQFAQVEEGPQLRGRSGGYYRVTAAIGEPTASTFVQAVAGTSKQTRQRAVEHAYTMFSDVDGALPIGRKLVVLSENNWRSEQTALLSSVAYVGSWSYRERLLDFIGGVEGPHSRLLMPNQTEI
jgi:Domain of unknown function DUF1828